MNLRIGHKLFLAMLVTSALSLAVLVLAQRYSFEQGFLSYARQAQLDRLQPLADELAARYAATGGWEFIAGNERWPRDLLRLTMSFGRPPPEGGWVAPPDGRGHERPFSRADPPNRHPPRPPPMPRLTLIDADERWIAGTAVPDSGERIKILVDDETVGYLILRPLTRITDQLDLQFARQQNQGIFWVAIFVLAAVTFASAVLARSFGAPIRALARATDALAKGDYDTRLDVSRSDELGRLADDFDSLAGTLKQVQRSRQQWVADISHELRTPIAVLQAELEALEDGVRPLDHRALGSLSAEVKRLGLLVEDLRQLTLSDSGTLTLDCEAIDLAALLEETVGHFRARLSAKSLSSNVECEDIPPITADPNRLRQLFANLLENAVRYTDPGGTIRIAALIVGDFVRITVEDSAPGVPDDALPHIFDRLYRVDPSRSRETGSSGLGLAICEAIAVAHGGVIAARHSSLGGLAIDLDLPLEPPAE